MASRYPSSYHDLYSYQEPFPRGTRIGMLIRFLLMGNVDKGHVDIPSLQSSESHPYPKTSQHQESVLVVVVVITLASDL